MVNLSLRQSFQVSISSDTMPLVNGTHGGAQMFARTGIYRNVVVALKPIEKTRIELTRSLLIELKNVMFTFLTDFKFKIKNLYVFR